MNKQEFIEQLRNELGGVPREDVEERLAFYGEMIDDRIEDGLSEDEAVSGIGTVDEIKEQIISDIPLAKLVKERARPKHSLRIWEIVLLVLGSPVWLALMIAAFAVLLTVYVVIWAVMISLWAVEAAFIAGFIGGLASGVLMIISGNMTQGLIMISAGIVLAGLSVFMYFGCRAATKASLILTKKTALGIKSLFLRKENTR